MKKNQRLLVSICATLIAFSLTACQLPFSGTVNVNNITFTDFSKDISVNGIYNTIKKFSSTDNARITGFEGEKNTAEYIAKQFKDMGFNVTEQSFPIVKYSCAGTEVDILTAESKSIASHFLTYSKATPKEGITADIVFGGMGTDDELENAKVEEKIVLMKRGGEFFRVKTARAFEKGAVGAIFYDPDKEQLLSATLLEPSDIPAVSILKSDAESIVNTLDSGKSVKVKLKIDSECKDGTSENIIATMKSKKHGSGKSIVVGAHYDGVDTPAANDNASGIAVVMEAAKVLSGQKLNCDINFIAFGSEETGLVGSHYYVSSLTAEEKNNTIAMLNLDMVGVGDTLKIYTMEEDAESLPVDLAVSCANKLKYKNERSTQGSSDNVAFESAGIPAAYFEYGPYEDYHTDKDTIDRIQKGDLLQVCNVVINMCKEIGKNPGGFSKR